jgi:hypothetical protein
MAQTKRIDVRVPVALAAWVESYAESRASSRSAVVCWALREAMALAAAGVPEIGPPPEGTRDGRSARVGRVPGAGSRASSSPGAPAASSRPAAGAPASVADVVTGTGPRSTARAVPEAVRARQERLNRAKGMR